MGSLVVSVLGFLLVKNELAPLDALARQTARLDASRLDQRLDAPAIGVIRFVYFLRQERAQSEARRAERRERNRRVRRQKR